MSIVTCIVLAVFMASWSAGVARASTVKVR